MTNQNPVDPRPTFTLAAATALDVIGRVGPDQLALPTPCDEFNVEQLMAHTTAVLGRAAALGRGENAMARPDRIDGVNADGWVSAFTTGLAETLDAWSDDATLDKDMTLPWASAPGRAMLPTYTCELTVHTWDLARAIGAQPHWHRSVVDQALVVSARLLPDGERETMTLPNGMPVPFASAVVIDDDAPAIDRLIAWYGRNPS